jgi:HEAT repeat protein
MALDDLEKGDKQVQMEENLDHVLSELQGPKPPDSTLYKLSNLHGPPLEQMRQSWPELPTEIRQRTALRMVEISEADFEVDFSEVFKICLDDEEPQLRALGIEGLWEDEDVALIRPLIRMLTKDRAPMVREAAAMSLSRFALQAELGHLPPRLADMVWAGLWSTLQDESQEINIRRRSLESLAYFSRPEVDRAIQLAHRSDEPMMRISAVFAMGRSANEEWGDLLLDELERDDPQMRYEAARASGQLRVAEAVTRLSRLVADPDLEVKMAAVWALGQIGGQEAQRVLQVCIEQGDEALRDAAEEALDELDFMDGDMDMPLYDFDMDDEDEEDEIDWEDEVDIE